MKKKLLISIGILLSIMMGVGCSQSSPLSGENNKPSLFNQTVSGSYIVNVSGGGEPAIRRIFGKYDVVLVRSLGNEQFEMQLGNDPGLDALQKTVTKSEGAIKAVQPNFVYHDNTRVKATPEKQIKP